MDVFVIDIQCTDFFPDALATGTNLAGDDFEEAYVEKTLTAGKSPRLIIFGRLANGRSTCIVVDNYRPWIRLKCKSEVSEAKVRAELMKMLHLSFEDLAIVKENLPQFYGFEHQNGTVKSWPCLKIYFSSYEAAQKYEYFSSRNFFFRDFELTDSCTTQAVKASNELKIFPSEWIRIQTCEPLNMKISTCDDEFLVRKESIVPLTIGAIAPLKIMSFDAEMYSHDNGFPEVINGDFVIAICATIKTYGKSELQRFAFIFHDEPLQIDPSIHLVYCESSHDVLEKFRDLIVSQDPDILTGWNIFGFDMPFLWDQYKSAYVPKNMRGSEGLHESLLAKKKLPGFVNTKDLLKKNKSNDPTFRKQVNTLEMRWRLALKTSSKLPEVVAAPIRRTLRDLCNLHSEQNEGLTIGGSADFALFQDVPRFTNIMAAPVQTDNLRRFEFLSRLCCERSKLTEKRMSSAAKGDNTYYFWSGRCCVDLMQIIKDDKKLDDNTLKFTAQTYLDPEFGKLDMTPAEIFASFRHRDPTKLSAMIHYCMRDSDIPILLMDKLGYLPLWVEMSRVSYTPMAQVLNGGQQRKVYNLIAHFVHGTHAINKGISGWPVGVDDAATESVIGEIEDSMIKRKPDYQGATVIEPKVGFYTEPISTCDFASLYPSVIIDSNLCPSTYVLNYDCLQSDPTFVYETHKVQHSILRDIANDVYEDFEKQYTFVKNVEGIIPRLLQHLLKARKIAKKAMGATSDPFEKSVQNGRQLALKVSCNSVYGFFGTNPTKGIMSCKPIAAVTTLRGRAFIEASKQFVEKNYIGSKVIYGDTDSIMISWGQIGVAEAYNLAEDAAAKITEILRQGLAEGTTKPILESALSAVTLANEKVYCPYLLIQKKTYAGLKFELKGGHKSETLDDFESCLDMKGVDAVRRDRSKLVKTLSEGILDALLIQKDLKKAVQQIKDTVDAVAKQKAPLEWFVLSKSLKSTYASVNQPHVQAWRRMQARGDADVPEIGTRMPYVIVVGKGRDGPLYERTEHPEYVRLKKIKYCAKYYLENAKDVVVRLLGPTGQGPAISQLFSDAIVTADTVASGNMSLMAFKRAKL